MFKPCVRLYSTKSVDNLFPNGGLNPHFVTGLADGDGSFYITFRKDVSYRLGYSISPEFKIVASVSSLNLLLLESVKKFFGGIGTITKFKNTYSFTVRNKSHLRLIYNHFSNYPLQTTKHVHFILWSRVLNMIENKEHIVESGFLEILAIKSLYPTGLNENLKEAFPNIVSIEKPEFVANTTPLNGHWVAGFTQADGSFGLSYFKVSNMKLGYTGQASFRVTQHERDLIVLNRITDLLGYGSVRVASKIKKEWVFSVTNNLETVSSFFKEYPIYGTKQLDFECFNKGILILKNKEHLTPEGLMEFKTLVDNMNSSRSVE